MLVVLDESTRECLAIEVRRRMRGGDVVVVFDELTAIRGAPAHIRSDNGPEFISAAVRNSCKKSGTGALYIEPGIAVAERDRGEL
jgi:putative transposase